MGQAFCNAVSQIGCMYILLYKRKGIGMFRLSFLHLPVIQLRVVEMEPVPTVLTERQVTPCMMATHSQGQHLETDIPTFIPHGRF